MYLYQTRQTRRQRVIRALQYAGIILAGLAAMAVQLYYGISIWS